MNVDEACAHILVLINQLNDVYHDRPIVKVFFLSLYSIVIGSGAIANVTVLLALIRSQSLHHNVHNWLILHLALSDTLLCCLTAPFTLYFYINEFWPFGMFACKTVAGLQAVNTFVSSFTLAAIALFRVQTVTVHSSTTTINRASSLLTVTVCAIWFMSISLAAPYFLAVDTRRVDNNTIDPRDNSHMSDWLLSHDDLSTCPEIPIPEICVESGEWNFPMLSKNSYSALVFAMQYFCPLVSLIITHGFIAKTIRLRLHFGLLRSTTNETRRRKQVSRAKRNLLLLASLVAVFALCWLPFNAYNTMVMFDLLDYDHSIYLCCHLIAMLSATLNPVFYGIFNSTLRKAVFGLTKWGQTASSLKRVTTTRDQSEARHNEVIK